MSYTHTIGTTYRTPDGIIASTVAAYTGDSERGIDASIPPSDGIEFDLAVPLADLRSVMLWSDQDVVVLTNDPFKPQDNIFLPARQQLVWTLDTPVLPPFANDVSKFFAGNQSGISPAKFKVRVLLIVRVEID